MHIAKRGLEGDSAAARSAMGAIEEARAARGARGFGDIHAIIHVIVTPGSVNTALEPLRMAIKLDRYRETARMAIEPWLVEEALSRLDRKLSREEQAIVVRATQTPPKVRWPDWWEVKP